MLPPGLSYADLEVQGGDEAQATFLKMWNSREPKECADLARALEAYCTRDTEAQLALHWWACAQVD